MILKFVAFLILSLYSVALTLVTVYGLLQFHLLLQYRKRRNNHVLPTTPHPSVVHEWPSVTIQLPIYNERFVVERLLDNIVKMDYPADKLQIQILDDSTDGTSAICLEKLDDFKQQGIHVMYLHRSHRDGFKAGALQEGLKLATGEFIAIFDADFLPNPDFLRVTLPAFTQPQIGVVQARWEHLNRDYSLITQLQAFQLNVHFTIEQTGRQCGNYFRQFNGTAGIWRRQAIDDAGGWTSATLTEDLELSYKAQLKGWQIVYLQDVGSPAELPAEMNGLKSQQFRWMKGGAENARRLIPDVLRSNLSLTQKIHATAHLLSSSIFVLVFVLAIVSVPLLFLHQAIHVDLGGFRIFMVGLLSIGLVYFIADRDTRDLNESVFQRAFRFVFMFPVFLCFSMGLSLHNSVAVMEGFRGYKSDFVRTPKFGIRILQDNFGKGLYASGQLTLTTVFEGILTLYFLIAVLFAAWLGHTTFLLYHMMLMIGFGSIFIYSIKHLRPG